MSLSHLESAFAFYASYHSNKANQFIHILCVWPILITGQIFLTFTAPIVEGNSLTNWSLVMSVIYMIYYFFIEQPGVAGPLASLFVLGGFYFANKLHDYDPSCWKIALAVHIFCWAAQIYGHQAHEKRAPAFFDNLGQAFLMAPLFVLMEVMFSFGYKPEFQKKAFAIAKKNIAEFRSKHPKKI